MSMPNILCVISGGIGDQVTAEPALRYALNRFQGQIDISILCHNPWLYSHLKFKEVFTVNGPPPDFKSYSAVRGTYPLIEPGKEQNEAICSFNSSGVNYCSLQFLKWELPFKDREIFLLGDKPEKKHEKYADPSIALNKDAVLIHAGISNKAGWVCKNFPLKWWEEVVDSVSRLGAIPVLIGQDSEANGAAKIYNKTAINLVNKLNLKELIYTLQRAKVLITNDSLPLHIAASREPEGGGNDCWIGMLATAKNPDFLMHYRKNSFGYRMKNLSLGGVWSRNGISGLETDAKSCTEEEIKKWLPQPSVVARWSVLAGRGQYDE